MLAIANKEPPRTAITPPDPDRIEQARQAAQEYDDDQRAIINNIGLNQTFLRRWLTAAFDANVWSGRALQEDFVELAAAVLHQCIRPLIGAFAPGHHGYQRACVLISGQASIGPFGSPVFACAGKTEPPSRLILSQTSAGNC